MTTFLIWMVIIFVIIPPIAVLLTWAFEKKEEKEEYDPYSGHLY